MLSCKESTRLLSEAQERSLTRWERVALRFHTLICSSCRRFGRQLAVIRESARRFSSGNFTEKDFKDEGKKGR